jgi:methyl-accepting chemotaxis protein
MSRSSRFTTVATWVAGVLIAASVIAGWIAVGRLAEATQRALARTEQSLVLARELAANTVSSASELQGVIGSVGDGLSSTGDALAATRQVSAGVRKLLGVVSIFNRVEDLSKSLTDAEAAIANVEASLSEASGSIAEAGPVLDKAVTSMQSVPTELDRTIAEVESSRARIGEQVWLWRLAIVAGGAALGLMLVLLSRLLRFVNDRMPAEAASAPLTAQP